MVSKDDIDLDSIKLGMQDIFSGTKPRLSNDAMRKAMVNYQEAKKKREMAMANKFSTHKQKRGSSILGDKQKEKRCCNSCKWFTV